MITAPITGEPKIVEMAAKLPAAAITARACWGAFRLDEPNREDRQAHAERDERCLRPEHEPEAEGRERSQDNARKLDRLREASACLETVGGDVAPVSR